VSRLADIRRLYEVLADLEYRMGGARRLRDCDGRMGWPARGVYFFLDSSEPRTDSGSGARIVRVGTHALTKSSRATLWSRLAQHRGSTKQLGGNHRGSIFRRIVGEAVAQRDGLNARTWGYGNSAGAAAAHFGVPRESLLADERALEQLASGVIGDLRVIVLPVDELIDRGFIEHNAIALLSNFARVPIDPASSSWLGRRSRREHVRGSGLWNEHHVNATSDPRVLERVAAMIPIETNTGARRVSA
jgi:hypothetical protein